MSINKNRIKVLNIILEDKDFYPFLCDYSNNNIDTVIDNLSKIINYVLISEDEIPDTFEELINNAVNYKKEGEYLILSTNSYLDNLIRLTGLNPEIQKQKFNEQLLALDRQMSFLTYSKETFVPLYGTIKQAITKGFTTPSVVYDSIAKQPLNNKRPLIVGESEEAYYTSILQRRLKNVPSDYSRTGANIAKKILREIIGKDITLYFLPTDKELGEKELLERVGIFELRSIRIPSRYTLLSICAKNKGYQNGTHLSIDTGEEIPKITTPPKRYSSLAYYNYERVPINSKFKYENDELSGDVSYDLDDLYGMKDTKQLREMFGATSVDERLKKIKNSFDMNLSYRDGKYHISNGRHRILYLKNYFLSNYKYCTSEDQLKALKEATTVVATVERTIEDPEINKYLIFFEEHFNNVAYYKTNILNDDFDIIVVCGNYTYHLASKEDLIRFVKLMRKEEYENQFLIGYNSRLEEIPYEVLIAKLVKTFGFNILKMDLMDIINYIKNNDIIINDQVIDFSQINYERLYTMFNHNLYQEELNHLRRLPSDMIKRADRILEEYKAEQKAKK